MPYGSDPEATPEQLQRMRSGAPAAPAGGGYGKDTAASQEQISKAWGDLKTGKPAEATTSKLEGLWEGLKHGVSEDVLGAQKVLSPMAGPLNRPFGQQRLQQAGMTPAQTDPRAMQADIARRQAQGQQAYQQTPAVQQHPMMAGAGRAIGTAAPAMAIPGGGAASGVGRALAGAGQGAVGAGMASGGNPAQTALGAGAGGALGGAGAMIGPRLAQAYQEISQKFPNLMRMATGSEGRTPEAFQRATANEVLTPIGGAVPRNVKVGHDLVNEVGDKISDAYNTVLPKVTFRASDPDPYTGQSFMTGLKSLADEVPAAHTSDFTKLMKRQIEDRVDVSGNMAGEAYKKVDSEIERLARRYSGYGA